MDGFFERITRTIVRFALHYKSGIHLLIANARQLRLRFHYWDRINFVITDPSPDPTSLQTRNYRSLFLFLAEDSYYERYF